MDQDEGTKEASELILAQTVNLKRQTQRLCESQSQLALRESSLALKVTELEDFQRQLLKDEMELKVANQSNDMLAGQLTDAVAEIRSEKATAKLQILDVEHKLKSEEQAADQSYKLAIQKF